MTDQTLTPNTTPTPLEVCYAVLEWARTPGNHGGNPYGHEFVKMAARAVILAEAIADTEGR